MSIPSQSTAQSMTTLQSILTYIRKVKSSLNDGWICGVNGLESEPQSTLDVSHFLCNRHNMPDLAICFKPHQIMILVVLSYMKSFSSLSTLLLMASWLLCWVESSSDPSVRSHCLRKHGPIMAINNNGSVHLAWWLMGLSHSSFTWLLCGHQQLPSNVMLSKWGFQRILCDSRFKGRGATPHNIDWEMLHVGLKPVKTEQQMKKKLLKPATFPEIMPFVFL